MINKLTKLRILKGLLDIVRDISDAEYQEKVWIKRLEPASDFDETMCHFFDDYSAKDIISHPNDFDINPDQLAKLIDFYNALEIYSDNTPGITEKEVVHDPEWHKIRALADEVLNIFNYEESSSKKDF